MNAFALTVFLIALAGAAYRLLAARWISKWLDENVPRSTLMPTPPVSYLRPIKRAVPGLRDKLNLHLGALRAGDELIVGLDMEDEGQIILCEELALRDARLRVVRCTGGSVSNPKIAKLLQMAPLARNDRWILCDSELLLDAEFAALLNAEWTMSGADAMTCAYRFVNLDSWPQRLDALSTLLTLWPGLAVLRTVGRGKVKLALGACTAVRGSDVDLASLGEELAEDFHLGARLAKAGKTVRLSAHLAVLDSDPLTWMDYWRHQLRVSVTYKTCRPFGFAMQVLVHPMSWAVLAALTGGCAGMLGALGIWAACVVAARNSLRDNGVPIPWLTGIVAATGWMETVAWVLSWRAQQVWWGGRWRPVSWRGKLAG